MHKIYIIYIHINTKYKNVDITDIAKNKEKNIFMSFDSQNTKHHS